ncbi:unnamed protein product [Alopecurus aequalis]
MSTATIHAVLRRRAIAQDLGAARDDNDDAYWASPPRLYDFSKHHLLKDHHPDPTPSPSPDPPSTSPPRAPAPSPPSPSPARRAPATSSLPPPSPSPAPGDAHLCLLALQGTGVSWGVRKRVRFVHRQPRRAHHNAAVPPTLLAQSAPAQADEESSSNIKPADHPEPKQEAEAEGGDQEVAEKKKRKRSWKAGGFTLSRAKKRARKPPAPKAEPVAAPPPRALADRSVAQVYAATEAESKQEVARSRAKRKEGGGTRAAVAKRPRRVLPKKEVVVKESGQVERKPVVVKVQRKKSAREEDEESGQVERKPIVVKALRKKSAPEDEESGRDERKPVVVKAPRRKSAPEDEESGQDERKPVIIKDERKRTRRKTETKPRPAPENRLVKVDEPRGAPRAMVDRWAATRYASAEASLLDVMRSLRARAGKPVQRRQLRDEARKRVGDTGLLDHLLKHTKDKVTPDGKERLRRRHNADGAMEYWLEPAGLAALRRDAGVADPYWVPPPGWKLGDPVSPDACALEMKRQVEELATELAGVKRHMEQLMKAHPGRLIKGVKSEEVKAYISHEPYQEKYGCMVKANGNLEKQVLSLEEKYADAARVNSKLEEEVLFLKEKYEAVVEKNTRLEEQMTALSTSFLSLKDDLLFLNDGEQQLQLIEPEQAEHLRLCSKECPEAEKQESNGGSLEAPDDAAAAALAVVGAGDQLADIAGDDTSSGAGGKRTSRKCSVRICKPQGAFQWPDVAAPPPSSPVTPPAAGVASMDDEGYMMAGGIELPPTPPSASSTNASSSAKLLLLPAPESSPVQPPPPPPPAACVSPRDIGLQESAQPHPGPDLQLRHSAQDASSPLPLPLPCGATAGLPLPEGTATTTMTLYAGGGGAVGTELALATPSY